MDLSLTSDQIAILDALDAMAKPFATMPIGATGFALTSAELDRELATSGFLDVGRDPDLGPVTAALVVERLARLPYATEAALGALVGPLLGEGVTRPICVVEAGQHHRPLRFLAKGATLVVVGEAVSSVTVTADQVRAEPGSLFAYPMGTWLVDPFDISIVPGPVFGKGLARPERQLPLRPAQRGDRFCQRTSGGRCCRCTHTTSGVASFPRSESCAASARSTRDG